jgi:hypothetical protein
MAVPFGTIPTQSSDYECRSGNIAVAGTEPILIDLEARARRACPVPEPG